MSSYPKTTFREILQLIIIGTSFPPLLYLYKMIYKLSIALAVKRLRRINLVTAIYLRRGLAKGEAAYGLSDIDLSIIIQDRDTKTVELAKERIISIYNNLSRFIPFLGKVDEELGLYTISELYRLYKGSNFLKHKVNKDKSIWKLKYRFRECKRSWILLSGRDITKDLPKIDLKELYVPAAQELKLWWGSLAAEFDPDLAIPHFKRKYLWYKVIAEAARIYLFICKREDITHRKTALATVKKYLSYEQNKTIEKVESYMKDLPQKENLIVDSLLKLFIELNRSSFDCIEKFYIDTKGKIAELKVPSLSDFTVREGVHESLKKLKAYALEEFTDFVDYIALIPQIEFSIDVLSNDDIDSFYLVLLQKDFIPYKKLQSFNIVFKKLNLGEAVEAFVTDGKIALSLHAKEIEHCVKSHRECPLFFSLLSNDLLKPFARKDKYIKTNLPISSFEEIIKARVKEIDEILSDKKAYKMKSVDFLRFFWGAARTKLLARFLMSDKIYIPITSRQIFKMLIESFPKDTDWLNALHTEYNKELLGEESQAYRLFVKSVDFLRRI